MANTIIAGNATNNGLAFSSDSTGALNILTGSGAGTTALSIDASQVTTFAAGVSGTTGSFSGNLSFNSGYGSAAVAYGCRAWVNFNGTGTVAIRASGNVTSITDNGTGDYTVNFTTAMPDKNYVISGCGQYDGFDNYVGNVLYIRASTTPQNYQLTTSARVIVTYAPGTGTATNDSSNVMVAIHR